MPRYQSLSITQCTEQTSPVPQVLDTVRVHQMVCSTEPSPVTRQPLKHQRALLPSWFHYCLHRVTSVLQIPDWEGVKREDFTDFLCSGCANIPIKAPDKTWCCGSLMIWKKFWRVLWWCRRSSPAKWNFKWISPSEHMAAMPFICLYDNHLHARVRKYF